MLKRLLLGLVIAAIALSARVGVNAAIVDIALYPMGESSSVVSGRPQDTTGNGHHYNAGGQGVTVQTSSPSPVSGTYIDLRGNPPSGVNGAYQAQYGTGMPSDNFVVEMWARTADDNGHIWASDHNTTTGSLRFEASGNNWAAGITGVAWINTSHPISANIWTHLAVIKESGTSRFYVDGQLQSGTATGAVTWTTSATLGLQNTTPRNYYTGDLDALRIFTFDSATDDPVAALNIPNPSAATVIIDTSNGLQMNRVLTGSPTTVSTNIFSTYDDNSSNIQASYVTVTNTDLLAALADELGPLSGGQSYQINSATFFAGTATDNYSQTGNVYTTSSYDPGTITWNNQPETGGVPTGTLLSGGTVDVSTTSWDVLGGVDTSNPTRLFWEPSNTADATAYSAVANANLRLALNAQIIPEPSTFILSALGLLSLLGWRRRRRR